MRLVSKRKPEIDYISNCLNTSKTKTVWSFQRSDRFKSFNNTSSPDKYYDIPSVFESRSVSPGRRFRDSFQRERVRSVEREQLSSSFDSKEWQRAERTRATTFGIGRQEYYLSKRDKIELGPGAYDLKGSIEKKPFYMGKTIMRKPRDDQPNCATYVVPRESYERLSTTPRKGVPKLKKEVHPKHPLQKYDNHVPGPGSYAKKGFVDMKANSYRDNHYKKRTYTSFGIGDRMKSQRASYLGPGSYNKFSEFGKNYTSRYY